MRKCYVLKCKDVTNNVEAIRVFTSLKKAQRNQAIWTQKLDFLGIDCQSSIKIMVLE